MTAYYNEIDQYAAQWLRNLIAAKLIVKGDVDTRSILDVPHQDLRGYTQLHFFAGIGGWSYALRLAGWPDDCPVMTGSCPCQPFSLAGQRKGFDDDRHLWPVWFKLIQQLRPPVVFGEQVASAADWLRLVRSDLEALGYAVGAIPVEAASAGADHLRDRYWFVADGGSSERWQVTEERDEPHRTDARRQEAPGRHQLRSETQPRQHGGVVADADQQRAYRSGACGAGWDESSNHSVDWVIGADGKSRRVKSGVRLLAHGVPDRVAKLRAFGNAIYPPAAAAFIEAYMTCDPNGDEQAELEQMLSQHAQVEQSELEILLARYAP